MLTLAYIMCVVAHCQSPRSKVTLMVLGAFFGSTAFLMYRVPDTTGVSSFASLYWNVPGVSFSIVNVLVILMLDSFLGFPCVIVWLDRHANANH